MTQCKMLYLKDKIQVAHVLYLSGQAHKAEANCSVINVHMLDKVAFFSHVIYVC